MFKSTLGTASAGWSRGFNDSFMHIVSPHITPLKCEWLSASGSLSDCRGAIKQATERDQSLEAQFVIVLFGKSTTVVDVLSFKLYTVSLK